MKAQSQIKWRNTQIRERRKNLSLEEDQESDIKSEDFVGQPNIIQSEASEALEGGEPDLAF